MRRSLQLPLRTPLVLALCGLLPGLSAGDALDAMKKRVRQEFPSVRQLSPADLAAWLSQTNQPQPVLLDVRTPAEYAVSHLPGARRVDPRAPASRLLHRWDTNQTLVLYCSVGYRSSRLAERLQRAGRTNVFNLDGSIFQWANEDRPLERNGAPVKKVHAYNEAYGLLLRPEYRAPIPPAEE